ncbi:flagellar assembly protein FliW [Fictibacillus aquaticus]|uniref:Flagellar assembly factor FliW n=1 Tax=Fictibacillus aquaticus TaxID=2021314 RepID=A0A235FFG7_9BACL|nr:flagellar assembly protein FliW [Fictibacillus aquaticus]OYD59743.1 flagellar assembly protein FliW [Fictibacillus aquaticus]
MLIETKYDQQVEVKKEDIIQFDNGIPGFEDETEFVLVPFEETVFSLLQSVHTKNLAFMTAEPFYFFPDYHFDLPDSAIKQLDITIPEDVNVLVIITATDPFVKSTVNLQGPIIINTKNNRAKQVVLNDSSYTTRHPLIGKER